MQNILNAFDDAMYEVAETLSGALLLSFCATIMCIMGILMLAMIGALWVLPVAAAFSALVVFIEWDTFIQIRRPVIRIHIDVNPTPQGVAYSWS